MAVCSMFNASKESIKSFGVGEYIMEFENQNILFFTRTMQLGGTENVVLQLCEIFKPLVNKIVVCSCGGVNVKKLASMGIRHYTLPDIESKSPSVILDVCAKLEKIVSKENITLIHTHHRMAAFYVAVLGLYKKCAFFSTAHNTFYNKKALTQFSYKHSNLIACGDMVKKNLVDFYSIPEKQVDVIHNAVKPFKEDIISDRTIRELHNQGYFLVGNVGRLSEQKGMEYFIKAIPEVLKKHDNARFLIVGSGEDEEKLKRLTETLDIKNKVIFLGYRNDIQNIISQLDLLVLSSLWEGLPLTPIEAFSVGKTTVATAVDGTPEIVEDGVSGILIEPKNSKAIAEKIVFMIENPDERLKMEKAAKKRFEQEFSFEKFAEKYIAVYKKKI